MDIKINDLIDLKNGFQVTLKILTHSKTMITVIKTHFQENGRLSKVPDNTRKHFTYTVLVSFTCTYPLRKREYKFQIVTYRSSMLVHILEPQMGM